MITQDFLQQLAKEMAALKHEGLYKPERVITSPQQAIIRLDDGSEVINFCANNYLGLADHPELIQAAKQALDEYGYGLSSVRFICGTQTIHKKLEDKLSDLLKKEDTLLYSSCFDANGGLFETLLTEHDAVISDALNHASIIDGIRLCKAKRYRYHNNDMSDLESKLKEANLARVKLIVTDGVFSMDGILANLPAICELAEKYNAMVMVDDSHAVGILGSSGGGTPDHFNLTARIDILTGTLGKALGGASGGYTSAKKEIIDILRQRSRPYLFSNSLAPMIVATSLKALDLAAAHQLRNTLKENTLYFRQQLASLGLNIIPGEHPIIPIMVGDAKAANALAHYLLKNGIYAVSFSYPVVPEGKARIRMQVSALHSREQLDKAIQVLANRESTL